MHKFKIGDLVRVKTNDSKLIRFNGYVGKVVHIFSDEMCALDTISLYVFLQDELELVQPPTTPLQELISNVQKWSIDRELHEADSTKQTVKLMEELGELASGLLKNKQDVVIDSLGDILVVLIILHQQLDLTFEETLGYAWNVIKDRKGKTENGVFIKEEDL